MATDQDNEPIQSTLEPTSAATDDNNLSSPPAIGNPEEDAKITVLLLAFFLGSFVARNSDLWLHLAAGRSIVQGSYHVGADPFSSTKAGTYWVNHNWLY